jgi:DNA ligase-1
MVLLANTYNQNIDPTGLWISEKLDGLRSVWDGKHLVSRNNNIFPAPDWFTECFPKSIPLDGELWLSRNSLEETSSIVRSGIKDKGWSRLKYLAFDIPEPRAGLVEERWDALQKLVSHINKPHLQFVPQTMCKGREHLTTLLDLVISQGGEGLMLRKPKSRYENRRSDTLLKVKKYYDDEAVVIGYEKSKITTAGKEHLIGSMGALICNNRHGEFKVGTGFSDDVRLNPPKIGCTITYKYLRLTNSGVPYVPVFVRVRKPE